jgi:hypothetical protein
MTPRDSVVCAKAELENRHGRLRRLVISEMKFRSQEAMEMPGLLVPE